MIFSSQKMKRALLTCPMTALYRHHASPGGVMGIYWYIYSYVLQGRHWGPSDSDENDEEPQQMSEKRQESD